MARKRGLGWSYHPKALLFIILTITTAAGVLVLVGIRVRVETRSNGRRYVPRTLIFPVQHEPCHALPVPCRAEKKKGKSVNMTPNSTRTITAEANEGK